MNGHSQTQAAAADHRDAATAVPPSPTPTSPFALPPPALEDPNVKQANRKAIFIGIVVASLLIAFLVISIYLLLLDPARTANIRDIVIILTAIVLIFISSAIGVLLAILIYRIQELTHFLRAELVPLLARVQQMTTDAKQTVSTVRGTTEFVSDTIAKPAIKVASFVTGVQQMAKAVNAKARDRTSR